MALAIAAVCLLTLTAACAEIQSVTKMDGGVVTRVYWQNVETGKKTTGPEGYAEVRYTYKKNETTETYFDADGAPCAGAAGVYGKKEIRDGKDQVTEIQYLGENGQLMLNSQGYARVAMDYNSFGEIRHIRYYGTSKGKVIVPSLGYAVVFNEYSNKTLARRTFQDPSENPVDSCFGYAVMRTRLNKRFQVTNIRYEHADGSPAAGPDGWFRCERELDDQGRLLYAKYYDVYDNLTDRGTGYGWEQTEYIGENERRVTRYSLTGAPLAAEDGVATLRQELQGDLVIRESYLDGNGEQMLNGQRIGAAVYGYDAKGRLISVSYEDLDGLPCLSLDGSAGYLDEAAENGATLRRVYVDLNGNPVNIAGGYCEIRYLWDELGQLTGTTRFNAAGEELPTESAEK